MSSRLFLVCVGLAACSGATKGRLNRSTTDPSHPTETTPSTPTLPPDLVITEIMMAPVGVEDAFGEWFEVQNLGDTDAELLGMVGLDDGGDDFTLLDSLVIPPGGRAVLGAWDNPDENGGVEVDQTYDAGFGLSNNADAIRLMLSDKLLDEVRWDQSYPLVDGWSLSLEPATDAAGNDLPASWCLAREADVYGVGGRGTPGEPNPPCPLPFEGLSLEDLEPGDLVFTEIMTNSAAVDDDFGEWFELTNLRDEPVDLKGLAVTDDAGEAFEVSTELVVEGQGRVVLGSFVDEAVNGGAQVDFEWRWDFGLPNSGDTLRIGYGTREFDAVSYDNGQTFPDLEGASMSLDPAAATSADNDEGWRWCPGLAAYGQGDQGTPGEPNATCPLPPGSLVITEWMADPVAVTGDTGEWVELYNPTPYDLPLDGLVLRDQGEDTHTIISPLKVPSHGHVVLGQSDDPLVNGGVPVDYVYGLDFKLGNADDEIVLESLGTLIDEVDYDGGTVFPDPTGASVQLDPGALSAESNDDGAEWCASDSPYGDGDLGTPGAPNDPC